MTDVTDFSCRKYIVINLMYFLKPFIFYFSITTLVAVYPALDTVSLISFSEKTYLLLTKADLFFKSTSAQTPSFSLK